MFFKKIKKKGFMYPGITLQGMRQKSHNKKKTKILKYQISVVQWVLSSASRAAKENNI